MTEQTIEGEVSEKRNGLVPHNPEVQAIVPVSETTAMLHMIERLARDPSVDIDKMRHIMEMRAQILLQAKEEAFDAAMAEAQKGMRGVAADKANSQTHSKYASYYALDKAIRPHYSKHGISLSFNTEPTASPETLRIVCRVSHDGYGRQYQVEMPADGKGARGGDVMTKTHATTSAVTYGMRTLLKMIFNIAVGGDPDDDDGNAAGAAVINEEQLSKIRSLIVEVAADIQKFCKHMKVERLEDIPAVQFQKAIDGLNYKKEKDKADAKKAEAEKQGDQK